MTYKTDVLIDHKDNGGEMKVDLEEIIKKSNEIDMIQ